jgi:predicted amidophosphoribosyltransferase
MNCPYCDQPIKKLKRKRQCAECHQPILRHHQWFINLSGRLQHKNCDQPERQPAGSTAAVPPLEQISLFENAHHEAKTAAA